MKNFLSLADRKIRVFLFLVCKYFFYAFMIVWGVVSGIQPRKAAFSFMRFTDKAFRFMFRTIMDVHVEIRGTALLPEGKFILAMKHQSSYDVLFPFMADDDPVLVVKKELMWVPVVSPYLERMKAIPVDRDNSVKAMKLMFRRAREEVEKGRSVAIFPEGTRGHPGASTDYKPGVALLYSSLDLPCVPVALNTGLFWPTKGRHAHVGGRIIFELLPPIQPGLDKRAFMHKLQESIEKTCQKLNIEGLKTVEGHVS